MMVIYKSNDGGEKKLISSCASLLLPPISGGLKILTVYFTDLYS